MALVRHEVAFITVMTMKIGYNQLFCQLFPTDTCVVGNDGVRSCRDNVASSEDAGRSARKDRDCQPQDGREPGMDGRVNTSESYATTVIAQPAKEAAPLKPKGAWSGWESQWYSHANVEPPVERRDPPRSVLKAERGNPVSPPSRAGRPQGKLWEMREPESETSEGPAVTAGIVVAPLRQHHHTGNRADVRMVFHDERTLSNRPQEESR